MLRAQEIAEIIEHESDKKGITIKQLLIDCKIKGPLVNNMKAGSMPSADKLLRIANYLDVSLDYLVTGEDAQEEHKLIIPPELEGWKFASQRGVEYLTQEEVNEVADFIKYVMSKRAK